jgi:hypothetical protein
MNQSLFVVDVTSNVQAITIINYNTMSLMPLNINDTLKK